MTTEADIPEEESHMERDGEDSFLTTRQFKITDNENSTEEFKRSEGQLNQDPGNLECLKESEIMQVSSNAHVEDMNGVNSCNFQTSKGEGFLELPGPPKVADDEACGLVHCQTDKINQSEISENLKHPQAGQHHEAVEDTRREYFEVMGEKNKSAGEKKVHHILNATENMLQIEYTGELGLVVEKEENTKNDIGLDEYVEFNTDQKIFNKEIQLRIQKETSDLDKDKKGASIEDKHSDLSSNQVLSVPETTLEQKNEASVHIPKFTVCDLGMGIRSVTQGCAKEENTDKFSFAHAALEPGKERSSEGINSKKAERSFDFVGGEECLKEIGCREDKITKKDDNEKITDHSTKDGSILTKAASQDTQTGEKVTFKGEDTVDEQLAKKPAIDGLDISIEEEVAIEREKKHTDAPATVYNEKSQDTTESSKQLNSHLAQNEVQDKDSLDTLSITDIEDKCSLQVDNPQMPKIYPGTMSELDALEKYVHKKGQELETMEALAEEAIHKEASISPVTSKDNEMDAEKLTREESNTEAIEEHDNGLLLVSIQDGATKTSNDEENDAEKPHKVIVDESELHTAGESIPCERDGDVLHEECTYLDPLDTSTEEKGVVNTVSSREAKDDNINKVKAIENNVNAESKCHEQTTQEDESEGKLDEKVLPFLSGEVVTKPSGYAKGITCTKKKEAIRSLEETLELEKKEKTAIVNNANDTEEVELEISRAEQETKEQIFEKIDLVKSPCPIFSDKDPIDEHTNQDQEFTALETSCSSKNIGKENSEEQGAIDEIYYPLIKEDKKFSKEYKDNEMSLKEEKQESHLEKEKDISIVLSVKIFEEMCLVEVSNPEILKVNPRVRSPYITENSSIEDTNQIKMQEKAAVTSGFASGKGNIDENSEQKADVSRKFEEYVHNKHEGLDMTEASAGLAINTEGSTREVTEENRSHVVEKIEEEKCNTDVIIKGNMNIVIPAYTQGNATEELNEENESEKSNGKTMESEMGGEYESTLHKTNVDVERSIDALSMKQGESQLDESKNMAQMEAPAEGNRSVVILSAKETKDSDDNITSTMEKNLEIESQVEDDSEQSIHKYEHGQKVDDKLRFMINEETESEPSSKGTRNIACIKDEGATQNIAENSELEKEAKKANADSSDDTGEKVLKTTDAGQETKEHMLKENENVKDHCLDFHDTDKCEERINQDQKFTEFEITPSRTYTRKEDMVEQERSLEEGTIGLKEDVNEEVNLKEESEKINLVRKTKPEDLEDCLEPNKDHNAKMTTEVSEEDIIAQESNKVAVQDSLYVPEVFEEVIGQEFLGRLHNESKYESMKDVVVTKEAGLKEAEQEKEENVEDKSQKSTVNTLVMQEENETKTTRNNISKENKTSSEIVDEIQADNNQEFSSVPSIERDLIEVKEIPDETASRDVSLLGKEGTPFSQLTKEEKSLQKEDEPRKLRDVPELGSSDIVKETTAGEIENQIDHELHIIPEVFESTKASQETIAPNGTTHHLLDFTDKKPTEENGNLDKSFAGIKAEPVSTKTEKQELKDHAISEVSSSSTEKETAEEIPRKDAMNMEEEKGDKYLEFEEHIKSTNLIKEKIPETLATSLESEDVEISNVKEAIQIACQNEMWKLETLEDTQLPIKILDSIVIDIHMANQKASLKEIDSHSNSEGIIQGVEAEKAAVQLEAKNTKNNEHLTEELNEEDKKIEESQGTEVQVTGGESNMKDLHPSSIRDERTYEERESGLGEEKAPDEGSTRRTMNVCIVVAEEQELKMDADNSCDNNDIAADKEETSVTIFGETQLQRFDNDSEENRLDLLRSDSGIIGDMVESSKLNTEKKNLNIESIKLGISGSDEMKETNLACHVKVINETRQSLTMEILATEATARTKHIEEEYTKEVEILDDKNIEDCCSTKTEYTCLQMEDLKQINVYNIVDDMTCASKMEEEIKEATVPDIIYDPPNIEAIAEQPLQIDKDEKFSVQALSSSTSTEQFQVPSSILVLKEQDHENTAVKKIEENKGKEEHDKPKVSEFKHKDAPIKEECRRTIIEAPTLEPHENEKETRCVDSPSEDEQTTKTREATVESSDVVTDNVFSDEVNNKTNDTKSRGSHLKETSGEENALDITSEVNKAKSNELSYEKVKEDNKIENDSHLVPQVEEKVTEIHQEMESENKENLGENTDTIFKSTINENQLNELSGVDEMESKGENAEKRVIFAASSSENKELLFAKDKTLEQIYSYEKKNMKEANPENEELCRERSEENSAHRFEKSNETLPETKQQEKSNHQTCKMYPPGEVDPSENVSTKITTSRKDDPSPLQKEGPSDLKVSALPVERLDADKAEEQIRNTFGLVNDGKVVASMRKDEIIHNQIMLAQVSKDQLEVPPFTLLPKEQDQQTISTLKNIDKENAKEVELLDNGSTKYSSFTDTAKETSLQNERLGNMEISDLIMQNMAVNETKKEIKDACETVSLSSTQSNEGGMIDKVVIDQKLLQGTLGEEVDVLPYMLLPSNYEDEATTITKKIEEEDMKELKILGDNKSDYCSMEKTEDALLQKEELKLLQLSGIALETFCASKIEEKIKEVSIIEATYTSTKNVVVAEQDLPVEKGEILTDGAHFVGLSTKQLQLSSSALNIKEHEHENIRVVDKVQEEKTKKELEKLDVSKLEQRDGPNDVNEKESGTINEVSKVDTHKKEETRYFDSPSESKEITETRKEFVEDCNFVSQIVQSNEVLTKTDDTESNGNHLNETVMEDKEINKDTQTVPEIEENVSKGHRVESEPKNNPEDKTNVIFESTINENQLKELSEEDEMRSLAGIIKKYVMLATSSDENDEKVYEKTKQTSSIEENVKEVDHVKQELNVEISEKNGAWSFEETNINPPDIKQKSLHATCEKHTPIEAYNKESITTQVTTYHKDVSPMLQDFIGKSTLTAEATTLSLKTGMLVDTDIKGQEVEEGGTGDSSETTIEMSPTMISLSKLMQRSMKETTPTSEHVIENIDARKSKEVEQAQVENDDGGEELKGEATITYAPIAVESHQVIESRTKENLEEKTDLIFKSTINENKLSELDELGSPVGKNEKHVTPAINSGENEEIDSENTTKQNSPNEENVKEAVLVKQELITGVSEENYARCSEEANSPLDTKQQEENFHSTCEKHVLIEADNKENTPTQIIADHKNVSPMLQDSVGESTLTDEPTDIKPGNEMWIDTEITGQETAGEKGMGGSSETTEISPSMISLSELMHASMKETIPKSEHVIEDTEATESKEAEQAQVANDDERGEELKREAPITVENSGDVSVKVPHKKSHNILSGVSSKFKHSISKVKKVIACTSSHSKALSPKQNKKPDELID